MGRKIGDYVHLDRDNYREYGINRRARTTGINSYQGWESLVKAHNRIVVKSTNKSQIKGLEKFLNSLVYGEGKSQEEINREVFLKDIQPKVIELFNKKYPGLGIGQYYGVYKIPKETTREGLGNKANTYINLITNIMNKGELKKGEIDTLQSLIDRLKKLMSEKGGKEVDHEKLIDDLNAIMAKEKFSLAAVGDSFEIALGVISEALKGRELKEINGLTEGLWTGHETSSVRINASKFQEDVLKEMRESLNNAGHPRALPKVKNGEITFKATQDKADITFTWQGSDLHVSAKNYSLKSNPYIHLLGGTSMFTLLSLERPEYVNHYLNIMGTQDADRMTQARDDLKRLILIRALTGQGTGKSNVADTFIINIRSKKKIRVLTMSQIYNAYKKDLEKVEIKNFNNGLVANAEAATPEQRIGAMLADLHSRKLAVSIDANNIENLTK